MTTLKIMTSNIRFSNPADGLHDWPYRLPLLSSVINDIGPDILGTQEGRIAQLKELASTLPGLTLLDLHRSWIDERMYPCLFINPKNIMLEKSGDIWLSSTPEVAGSKSFDSAFPRLCTWAEVTVIKTGLRIMVVNVHLDHILSSTREKQIEVLVTEVKKLNSLPLLLIGDFNESPLTGIKTKLINEFGLKDPWVEKNYQEETSHHGFLGDKAISGDRIDWILIPTDYECSSLKLEKKSFKGVFPSDHYPIFATVVPK